MICTAGYDKEKENDTGSVSSFAIVDMGLLRTQPAKYGWEPQFSYAFTLFC